MRHIVQLLILVSLAAVSIAAQSSAAETGITRTDARPSAGFNYPYYLYVPPSFLEPANGKKRTILVLPNNTGKIDDDLAFHEADVKRRITQNSQIAAGLDVAILTPVFPRPASDPKTYTHALDRDTMTSAKANKKDYARPDLQLIAMIDDARMRLEKAGAKVGRRVLMLGFSASGMFVNRFAFLHPGHVLAAAIGSPGGWPIAPLASYKGRSMRYPVGTADLKAVTGRDLDLKKLRGVPMFIFLGDKDDNDSVRFDDSYDKEDRELIFPLFGEKPVDRWDAIREIYSSAGLNAEFKLYPHAGHSISPEMRSDILAFLKKHAR
jgi:predicted esterase